MHALISNIFSRISDLYFFLCFGVSTPFQSLATRKLKMKGAIFATSNNEPLVSYKLDNIAVRTQLLPGPGCSNHNAFNWLNN